MGSKSKRFVSLSLPPSNTYRHTGEARLAAEELLGALLLPLLLLLCSSFHIFREDSKDEKEDFIGHFLS